MSSARRLRSRAALLRCIEGPRSLLATRNAIAGDEACRSESTLAAVEAQALE